MKKDRMDDDKFRETIEFEDKNDCTIISPFFIQQLEAQERKNKQQFYYLVFQDTNLRITKISHGTNYDLLWKEGIERAKEYGGFWSILDIYSKFIDGNVVAK